jgi:hypothetical protein
MKRNKVLSTILALSCFLSASLFFGCDKEGVKGNGKEIVFADFENWAPNFQLMKVYNEFGRVTRNKNSAFVKSGKCSARLQPVGGYNKATKPCIVFPFESELFAFDYVDITNFKEITCHLYNDSETAINATIGFAKSCSADGVVLGMGKEFTLKPKAWTEVNYEIDCSFLSMLLDVERVGGLYIQFPDTGVVYPDEAPSIYLDDIIIKKAETKADVVPNFNLYTEGVPYEAGYKAEIMDFENEYQQYFDLSDITENKGSVRVVSEDEVGIMASHGEKMLQVKRLNERTSGDFHVYIPDMLMRAAGMTTVPVERWKEVYFTFDMYLDYDKVSEEYIRGYKLKEGNSSQTPLSFVMFVDGRWQLCKYGFQNSEGVNVWETRQPLLKSRQWTTWKISLYELAYNRRNAVESDYVTNPGAFKIYFSCRFNGDEYDTYLDNFRLEVGPTLANGEPIEIVFG